MEKSEKMGLLAQRGVLAGLILISKGPRTVSGMVHSEIVKDGIGSFSTVKETSKILLRLGLAEQKEEGRSLKLYITQKGRDLLQQISDFV